MTAATLVFSDGDGFESPWSPVSNPGNWDSFTGTPTSEGTIVHDGSVSMLCTGSAQYMNLATSDYYDIWIDFWWRSAITSVNGHLLQIRDGIGDNKISLQAQSDTDLVFNDTATIWDTTVDVAEDIWYHVFVHIKFDSDGSEQIQVCVNTSDYWDSWDYSNTSTTIVPTKCAAIRFGQVSTGGARNAYFDAFNLYQGDEMPSAWSSTIELTINDINHTQSLDNISIEQIHNLSINDISHSNAVDNIAIGQIHSLSIDELLHLHSLDNITITVPYILAIDDLHHNNILDDISITQFYNLAIDDLLSSNTLDNINIGQLHNLLIDELSHANLLDNITISIQGVVSLEIDSIDHAHALEGNIVLGQLHILSIDELNHSHLLDASLSIGQTHNLFISELSHSHNLDAIELSAFYNLFIDNLTHDHGLDSIVLEQLHILVIALLDHAHMLDSIALSQSHNLIVADILHSHNLDNIIVSFAITPAIGNVEMGIETLAPSMTIEMIEPGISIETLAPSMTIEIV